MVGEHHFILDLAIVLGSSALGGFIANRLRQPVLLGYLLSGLLVGPFGFGLLNDLDNIKALAEIGVAFLLFALGVEFSLAELKRFKDIAIQGSILQIGLTIIVVAVSSLLLGWVESFTQGIFLGAILSLSSTAVVLKTLTERGETNTVHGQVMLAILIAQDLALGLMLAILPALNDPQNLGVTLTIAILKVAIFFSAAFVAGYWLIPPLMKTIARTENSELFLLTVIALCLGVALITAKLGLSIEMGAFVAGLAIAEIDYSDQALAKILPLRDTFASLFFASIGMLIDPVILWQNIGAIIGLVVLVMLGKALIIFPIILKFGYSLKTATTASLGLNQIGEFSFVLALVALNLGAIARDDYLLLLGTTAITLVLTPIGLKFAPRLADKLLRIPAIAKYFRQRQSDTAFSLPDGINGHIVVAGYGRVGQVVVNILRDRDYPVLVIENSEAAIQRLRHEGIPYIFGDGDSELVLEKARLETAKALAIALPDPNSTRLLLKHALEFAPNLNIVARSHTNSEIDLLTQLGAKEVVQPEFEAALEMGASMLGSLGEARLSIDEAIRTIRTNRYLSIRPKLTRHSLKKDVSDAADHIHNEWVEIPNPSPLHGMTLAEANIRNLTGVTVMTVQRGNKTLYYPKGERRLKSGDRVLVVGQRAEVSVFQDLIRGHLSLNAGELQWTSLPEDSPLIGTTPAQLEMKYDIKVEALRRHGHLYRPVESEMTLEQEDYLLILGQRDRVNRISQVH
ncbi:cation:proton antiporter [Lusitaniella coriacea LEGE 07157]|uniref:Cation:proton antiporter n=1 Tax=Lusitaniella coriacea LEGE 07157 TaxID=945747 RepID=A0A8J7E0J0_9CYAN|nr:cation:proton antiporter [Lusitaniella coriacea]MBE9119107.1 cation:proton antiporter [Lusitaniella coriacea LEGE 07157]